MTRKKTLTANQRAFEKELKRARAFIRRAGKRGYFFQVELPSRPKVVTKKAIRELKETLKPASLYAKALYVVPGTGEAVSGTEGRTLERQAAARKGLRKKKDEKIAVPTSENTLPSADTESLALTHFFATLDRFWRAKGAEMLKQWAEGVISQGGRGALAHAIYMALAAGELILDTSLYEESIVRSEIEALNRYLPEQSRIPDDVIAESMEGYETAVEEDVMRDEYQW